MTVENALEAWTIVEKRGARHGEFRYDHIAMSGISKSVLVASTFSFALRRPLVQRECEENLPGRCHTRCIPLSQSGRIGCLTASHASNHCTCWGTNHCTAILDLEVRCWRSLEGEESRL